MWQKNWAGSPPSFGKKPKEQLLFFVKPSLTRRVLICDLFWSGIQTKILEVYPYINCFFFVHMTWCSAVLQCEGFSQLRDERTGDDLAMTKRRQNIAESKISKCSPINFVGH